MSEIRDEHDGPDCFGCGWQEVPGGLVKVDVESEIMPIMLCPECVSGLVACDRCGKTRALDADDFDQVRLPGTQEEPPEVDLICGHCNGDY